MKGKKKCDMSSRQKTLSFYQTVEAGDIALMKIVDQAIFLLGFTKAGKTSSGHCLCDSPLRVELQDEQLVYKPSSASKFLAKVGNITDSETEIPNIFNTAVYDTKSNKKIDLVVLDLPGYGDTYGFHRIFSNGYFHYRSFSKTTKIKFVVTFTFQDMGSAGSIFKRTIKNFINTFKNYASIKDKILEATSFLITKVDKDNCNLEFLKKKLTLLKEAVGGMGKKQRTNYEQIITNILDKNRIYWIPKPTQVGTSISQSKLLQDIYNNSQFWQRQRNQNNPSQIQMKDINFSVAAEIMHRVKNKQEELFQEDFQDFMEYTQEKIKQIITEHEGSLDKMVKQLVKDVQTKNESNNFLSCMEKLNQKYNNFSENYKEGRKIVQSELFKNEELESFSASTNMAENDSSRKEKDKKNYYFIKKFDVLSYLVQIQYQKSIQKTWNNTERTIEQLQKTSTMFKKIFKKFSSLSASKAHTQIIYNYSYIIQRLINEFKIITLIFFIEKEYIDHANSVNLLSQDLYRSITDKFLTLTLGEIDIVKLKKQFIKKVDFDNFTHINEDIIEFFEDLTNPFILPNNSKVGKVIPNKKPEQFTKQQMINISLRVVGLLKKYYAQITKKQLEKQISKYESQQSIYLIKKIHQYRKKLYDQIDSGVDLATKKTIITNVISISKMLAQYYLRNKNYERAKDCYISINDTFSLFEVYQKQINEIKNPNELIEYLLKYGDKAKQYGRKDIAIKCYQRAYSLSEECDITQKISQKIVNLHEKDLSQGESQYLDYLRRGKFCIELYSSML